MSARAQICEAHCREPTASQPIVQLMSQVDSFPWISCYHHFAAMFPKGLTLSSEHRLMGVPPSTPGP